MQEPRQLKPYLFIVASIIAVYASTLWFGFTYLDDNVLVLDNLKFLGEWRNLGQTFNKDVFFAAQNQAYYRPLLTVSLMLDTLWGGGAAWAYHLGNVLIHLAASWLVYAVVVKMGYRRVAALVAALIFALHPILTQAVAWVPGRNDSLLAAFSLASFFFLLNRTKSPPRRRTFLWFVLSMIFFALALFTKESALVLPLLFLLYRFMVMRKKLFSPDNFYWLAGYGLVVLLWLPLRSVALSHPLETSSSELWRSGFANLPAVILYLGKAVFPFNLNVFPNLKDSNLVFGFATLALLAVLMVVVAANRLTPKKVHPVGGLFWFGMVWFVVLLTPSLVRPNSQIMADFLEHRAYLPLFGLLLVFLELGLKNINLKDRFQLYGASVILSVLALVSFFHSQKFVNRTVFWQAAAQGSPSSPLAQRNLGAMYYLDGKLGEAKPLFEKALALNPQEPMAHNNLGLIYLNQNKLDEAQKEFSAEIALNPSWETAYYNLGLVFARQNKTQEAKAMWQKTLEINPGYQDARRALESW